MIPLDKIDHGQRAIFDAIGITKEEFEKYKKELEKTLKTEISELGFSETEISEACKYAEYSTEATVYLWKIRGRSEISIKEFLLTTHLVTSFMRNVEKISDPVNRLVSVLAMRAEKIVKEHGDQPLIGKPESEKWLTEHGSCKGCPSEVACGKVKLISIILHTPQIYEPNSFQDFLEMQKWMKETINKILGAKTLKELENIPVPL